MIRIAISAAAFEALAALSSWIRAGTPHDRRAVGLGFEAAAIGEPVRPSW
jgi:hypothetical protein